MCNLGPIPDTPTFTRERSNEVTRVIYIGVWQSFNAMPLMSDIRLSLSENS
jgi:hypothetical protein